MQHFLVVPDKLLEVKNQEPSLLILLHSNLIANLSCVQVTVEWLNNFIYQQSI